MGGPSSDFHALYQQRIRDSINGQPGPLRMRDIYRDESIQQTNLMPVATATSFDEAIRNAMALAEKEITTMPPPSQNALLNHLRESAPLSPFEMGSRIAPIPAQLLPKDLLPALRKAETPKEAARREVHDFIEQATGRNRTPLPPQFQSALVTMTSMVPPFQMRKF